jgi:catabolite regulation protein CreA
MKSAAKNKEKVQQKINKYKDPADFGLNIRQIKKIDIMNRKYSKKQNLLFVKDEQTCLKSKS